MSTINKFALQNIKHQNFGSLVFFFLVFIASTCIFGTGVFTGNMQLGVEQANNRISADIIAVPSVYGDDAKEALFEGNACTILFDKNPSAALNKVEGVKKASAQLFLETLKMKCCATAGVQIIAIDIHTDFAVGEWLKDTGIETLGENEIIAGYSSGLNVNDKISFYDREFTVAAVLEETGMGYDESVFVSYEAADFITSNPKYKEMFNGRTGLSSMILIETDKNYKTEKVKKKITDNLQEYGISAYSTSSLTEKLQKQLDCFKFLGIITNSFVVLLASVSLFSLITISFHQRRNRVGSLLSVGVEKKKIIGIFMTEYIYLVLAGFAAGIMLVSIFMFPLHGIIKHAIDLPYKFISFDKMAVLALITLAVNAVILLISASLTFYKIMKSEPAVLAEEQI